MQTKTNRADKENEEPEPIGRVGNLTRDPECQISTTGTPYTRFGLAVNRPVTPGDWSGPKDTVFYGVTCFGSLAKNVAETMKKGSRAIVVGRGALETWTTDSGEKRTTKRILADGVGTDLRFATATIKRTDPATSKREHVEDLGEDF
jgi:single-strand DNA-binding protein